MFFKSKYLSKILLSSLTLAFLSCDDGRIYEEEYLPDTSGRVMKLNAQLDGLDTWARGYSVVLAGFEPGNEYAVITKLIPFPEDGDKHVEVVMSGIPSNVTDLQLCVVNRQRVLVRTYASVACDKNEKDTIYMDIKEPVDVAMFDAVQKEVFSSSEYSCDRCHSGNKPAGGLLLTHGVSYGELLGKQSKVAIPESPLVKPEDAENSVLYLILGTNLGDKLSYNHSNILINSYTDLALVKDWITNGAKEK